jgi:hypothetical protein
MRSPSKLSVCLTVIVGMLFALTAPSTRAQGRLSDKDLRNLTGNLKDDAKSFKSPFNKALKQSSIRRTSRQKEGEHLANTFEKQTATMHEHFKKTKRVDNELQVVQNSATQIDGMIRTLSLGPQVVSRWEKIESELQQISTAFGVQSSRAGYSRDEAAYGFDGNTPRCDRAVGSEQAQRLAQECLAVSTATHPPCNVQNSCPLIVEEIKRGCASIRSRNVPAFCNDYR